MIDVVACAIRDGDEYLACRRRPERGGGWEFPGGKVEPGETLRDALRRELAEELQIDVVVGERLATVEVPDAGIRLISFVGHLQGERPDSSTDHDSLMWLPAEDLMQVDWLEADLPTVHAIQGR